MSSSFDQFGQQFDTSENFFQASHTNNMQGAFSDTMRSFRDQLSFNLQSLNLTLSSLSSSMNNLGSKIGELGINTTGRYLNSGINQGSFLGSVSQEYANAQGIANLANMPLGVSGFLHRPANINPLEYYTTASAQKDLFMPKYFGGMYAPAVRNFMPGEILSTVFGDAATIGSSVYTDNTDMIRRMSGRFSSGPYSIYTSQRVAKGLQRLSYKEVLGTGTLDNRIGLSGFSDIAGLGLQQDIFHGNTPEELLKQVKEVSGVVKVMTGILGSKDVKEAMDAVVQLKNMGLNTSLTGSRQYVSQLGKQAYGYGVMNGMTSQEMFNAGMQIAQSGYGSNGIPGALGIQRGMSNLAYTAELQKRGLLTAADIAAGGGLVSIAARQLGLDTQLARNSGLGYASLFSGLTNGGAIDLNKANAISANNGVPGIISAGINNMFGGRGVSVNTARAQVDLQNMLADSLKNNPNGFHELATNNLKNALGFLPMYKERSMTDKLWLGSKYLMDNYGMDGASAKSYMSEILQPSINRELAYIQNVEKQKANYEASRAYNSVGAKLYRATVEPLERFGARIAQPFVELGESITDFVTHRKRLIDPGTILNNAKRDFYIQDRDKEGNLTGTQSINIKALLSSHIGSLEYNTARKLAIAESRGRNLTNATYGGTGTVLSSAIMGSINQLGLLFGGEDDVLDDALAYQNDVENNKLNKKTIDLISKGDILSIGALNTRIEAAGGNASEISRNFLEELSDTYGNNASMINYAIAEKAGLKRDASMSNALRNVKVNKNTESAFDDLFHTYKSWEPGSPNNELIRGILGLSVGNLGNAQVSAYIRQNRGRLKKHRLTDSAINALEYTLTNTDNISASLAANEVNSIRIKEDGFINEFSDSENISPMDILITDNGGYKTEKLEKAGLSVKDLALVKNILSDPNFNTEGVLDSRTFRDKVKNTAFWKNASREQRESMSTTLENIYKMGGAGKGHLQKIERGLSAESYNETNSLLQTMGINVGEFNSKFRFYDDKNDPNKKYRSALQQEGGLLLNADKFAIKSGDMANASYVKLGNLITGIKGEYGGYSSDVVKQLEEAQKTGNKDAFRKLLNESDKKTFDKIYFEAEESTRNRQLTDEQKVANKSQALNEGIKSNIDKAVIQHQSGVHAVLVADADSTMKKVETERDKMKDATWVQGTLSADFMEKFLGIKGKSVTYTG